MKPYTFGFLVIVMLVAVLGLALTSRAPSPPPAPQQPAPPVRTFTVTGEGVVRATPDLAQVRFALASSAASPGEATVANDKALLELLGRLRSLGVERSDVDVLAERTQRGTSAGAATATWELSVTVRDVSDLFLIRGAVVRANPARMDPDRYDLKDRAAAQAEAVSKAVADARDKAAALAKEAGVRLAGPMQTTVLPGLSSADPLEYDERQVVVRAKVQVVFST